MDSTSSGTRLGSPGYASSLLHSIICANSVKESFNSRLKAEGDDGSTNLYISNLPKTLTEVVSRETVSSL